MTVTYDAYEPHDILEELVGPDLEERARRLVERRAGRRGTPRSGDEDGTSAATPRRAQKVRTPDHLRAR